MTEERARVKSDVKSLIRDPTTRQRIHGSINILEVILNERYGTYDSEIISNLRKINTLRSGSYPTHTLEAGFVEVIEDMDFTYPPDNWEDVWEAVLELCLRSFEKLVELLR